MRKRRGARSGLWPALVYALGAPLPLYAWTRSTLQRPLPTSRQLIDQPLCPATLTFAVLLICGLAWAAMTRSLLAAATRWLTLGRRRRRFRLPTPLHTLSATVLGVVAITTTTATAATAHTTPTTTSSDTLDTPPVPAALPRPVTAAPATLSPATYTVHHGDTLWTIARDHLGDPHRWRDIYNLNRERYDRHGHMHRGNHIEPGWVLTLPADATPPPAAQPADPNPGPGLSQPAPPATPQPDPSTALAPQPTSPAAANTAAPATARATPSASSAATSAATGAAPTAAAVTAASRAASETDPSRYRQQPGMAGVQVPGGWVSVGLGAALLAAVGVVWQRRRHAYRPTPITSPVLDDPDIGTPLAAATLLRRKQRELTPTGGDQPADSAVDVGARGPTVREYLQAERDDTPVHTDLPPIASGGPQLAGLSQGALTGGLGLTGAGAADAARALLVATLSCGQDDPDAQARLVIPAATLASLVGVTAVELGRPDRLHVADSLADALVTVEEEIIRRSRIVADAQVTDVAALRREDPLAPPLPQLLLIADAPDPAWEGRVATALGLGEPLQIAAVFLGDWTSTLTVAADGTTTGDGDTRRVAVLDVDLTAEAIAMLREAHSTDRETITARPARPPDPIPAPGWDAEKPEQSPGSGPVNEPAGHATDTQTSTPSTRPGVQISAQRVQVRVLGDAAVLDAAGQPAPRLRANSLELLVYLAVNRNGASRSDIMEAIWGEATLRRADERLSTCAANLRRVIRTVHASLNGHQPDTNQATVPTVQPIINTGGFYTLNPAIVDVDWWTVLDAYAAVATAPDDHQRLKQLLAAAEHLHGPLADGARYDWIDTDRELVRRHQIKILAQAADLLADTDPHTARTLADQACAIDPISENLARRAMRAAAAVGDADGVRHRVDTLRTALDGVDVDMDADTEHLATSLLRDLTRHHT